MKDILCRLEFLISRLSNEGTEREALSSRGNKLVDSEVENLVVSTGDVWREYPSIRGCPIVLA